ncbi:MAG TPA: GNAT family N-acetyltransferase [Acidimicrobiales bacterium]|jgi:GNAT superfamily N-acetyltransferase
MPWAVERVEAGATLALRQRVLRPHQTLAELASADENDDAETAHFAVIEDGDVIGTASVRRQAPPWGSDGPAWRLRGMATAEGRRSQGIGAAVLAAVIDRVRERGGGLLWCNARVPAVPFYQRAGFVTRGESWVEPFIGPHVAMERTVDAAHR